jgi:tetratricopeptide (TPR) repeat protein
VNAGQTGFFHQAVQEYFFAREVALHQSMEYVLKHVSDPEWAEVLVFVCGLVEDATEVVQEVMKVDPYLAAKCTTYSRQTGEKIVEDLVLSLIQKLKGKFKDVWYGKLYQEMLAILSIEPKLCKKTLSDLFLNAYDHNTQALHDFVSLLLVMELPEKVIIFLQPLINEYNNDVSLRRMLAAAYRNVGNFKDSIAHFEKCSELKPDDGGSLVAWGITYEMMKEFDEAEVRFRQAIELDKKHNWAYYHLGLTLLAVRKYDEALKQFQKAIELDWKYSGPHIGLADVYLNYLNQPEKAVSEYDIVLQLEERPFRLHKAILGLARALEAAGRTAEARQRYQEYLDRFPWGEHAPEALAALERLGA